jgi:hypothetical protein
MQAKRKPEKRWVASRSGSVKATDEPWLHLPLETNLDQFPALQTREEDLIEYERMQPVIVRRLAGVYRGSGALTSCACPHFQSPCLYDFIKNPGYKMNLPAASSGVSRRNSLLRGEPRGTNP